MDGEIQLLLGQIDGKLDIQGQRIETLFKKVDEIAGVKQELAVMQEICRNERAANKRKIEMEETAKREAITPWRVAIISAIVAGIAEALRRIFH